MNRPGRAIVPIVLLFVALIGPVWAEDVVVYREDLVDAGGYVYGANFYIDNNTSSKLYAVVYVTSRANAAGGVLRGAFLMGPNEKGLRVGSFTSADRAQPWSVYVDAKWAGNAADLAPPPEPGDK